MSFGREEYASFVNGKRSQKMEDPRYELLIQAGVKAEHLTGDENWDIFLSYIQGSIDQTTEHLHAWEQRLTDPELVDDIEMRHAKIAAIRCRERIVAWQAVIELPVDLRKMADEAKALMERIEPIQ